MKGRPKGSSIGRPIDWVLGSATEPFVTATLQPDAPTAHHVGQIIARRLCDALVGVNRSELERQTGVYRTTLKRIIDGQSLPDVGTIAKLEQYLQVQLWPPVADQIEVG